MASRCRSNQSQLLPGWLFCSRMNASRRWDFCRIRVATSPPRQCIISDSAAQKGAVQRPGTTARSEQISEMVRPMERRRTWRSRSCKAGMKSSGSSLSAGRDGSGAGLRVAGGVADCSASVSAGAGCGVGVRARGSTRSKSRPVAPRASRKQEALQCDGAQDAAVQVGEDGGDVGGAEVHRDGVEVGGGGAVADGVDQVAAVVEQDGDGVEQDGDVVGQSGAGVILRGVGRGGDRRGGCDGLHGGCLAECWEGGKDYFPVAGEGCRRSVTAMHRRRRAEIGPKPITHRRMASWETMVPRSSLRLSVKRGYNQTAAG